MQRPKAQLIWQTTLRFIIGAYWLFFSYQKWFDRSWVGAMIRTAAQGNYVPLYSQVLRNFVAPNSAILALLIAIVEATVGFMIILGILTRVAATVGALMDLNLVMTFSLCNCPWTNDFPLVFWFYFGPFLLNVQLIFDQSGYVYGLQTILRKFSLRS